MSRLCLRAGQVAVLVTLLPSVAAAELVQPEGPRRPLLTDEQPDDTLTVLVERPAPTAFALGVALAWQRKTDFGDDTRFAIAPELVALYYHPVAERLYVRPGVRVGVVGFDQAEMPGGIQVREWDLNTSAEVAVLFEGPVVPSVTFGAGMTSRWVRLRVDESVVASEDPVSQVELMPRGYVQFGVGIPLVGGRVLIEPFARHVRIDGDARIRWHFGSDVTFALF